MMPRLTNLFRRGSRAAAPVLGLAALTLVIGAGVIAQPASAGVTPGCQWQTLNLINGWRSDQSQYNSGDPSYCVSSGTVYLSGSMSQPVNGSTEFAVLPQEAWPTRPLYLDTYTFNGANGTIRIEPDGVMFAYNGAASSYTSLAGISFLQADAATPLILDNGWQSSQGAYGTGDPSFSYSYGTVYLSGSLFHSTSDWGPFAVLPQGARPADAMTIKVYSYFGAAGTLFIYPDGEMWAEGGSTAQFTSLAGISFPSAAVNAQQLTPLNSWTPPQTYAATAPSWYVSNGVVHLFGSLYTTGTSPEFAVLPQALWPTHTLYLIANYDNAPTAYLQINPDGTMYAFGLPPGHSAGDVFEIDGIAYHGGS
ncbi:MAG TPA: hypothetical protein VGS19_02875 [Streptosporangiaceae bacterium]|nr:hypothetical protein [Streptosporangiaceae bacterium]